jgi:hypothetical protein
MTRYLHGELVGGPHDGLRFPFERMLRSFPSESGRGTVPRIPDRVLALLGDPKPKPMWSDSTHVCTGTHPPLSIYEQNEIGDTRYQYVGPFHCAAAGQ